MVCKTLPSKIPCEIWFKIMTFCGLEEVLCLEVTCKYFFSLASSRLVWLERLQDLDQDHAPDLPMHIPIASLTWYELRNTVLKARRRFLNCTGPSPAKATREVIVPIGTAANIDGTLVTPTGWGTNVELLPGGRYLFVKWHVSCLQCWDVAAAACIWTYPQVPQEPPEAQGWIVCCFAYDMQADGDIRVLVVSASDDDNFDQRKLEVLHFSPPEKTLTSLFSCFPEVHELHGLPVFAKIYGDVLAVYTEGYLLVAFWEERHTIAIDSILDSLEIVDEYLICIRNQLETNSLVAIPLRFVHNLVKSDTSVSQIKLGDLPIAECRIVTPAYWLMNRGTLSVCKFHWKAQKERDDIAITVIADVYNEANECSFPLAEFFVFKKGGDFDGPDPHASFERQGRSKTSGSDQQFGSYSMMSRPSQAGSTVIAFHDDSYHLPTFIRTFATFMHDRPVVYKFLGAYLERRPATYSCKIEFYSGAVFFVREDTKDVVIQYYD